MNQNSGLKKALTRCQNDPDLGFIIARLDCLTRSLRMLRALISGSLMRINLFSVEEELDTRTRVGRSMLGVLESISQWESEMENMANPPSLRKAQHLEVTTEWWNIYGTFEGRLFRPKVKESNSNVGQS